MNTRPFRHLCLEADMRDAMTDVEFWDHVYANLAARWAAYEEPEIDGPDVDVQMRAEPCSVCGEAGACGFDAEGRALIHVTDPSEDA